MERLNPRPVVLLVESKPRVGLCRGGSGLQLYPQNPLGHVTFESVTEDELQRLAERNEVERAVLYGLGRRLEPVEDACRERASHLEARERRSAHHSTPAAEDVGSSLALLQ